LLLTACIAFSAAAEAVPTRFERLTVQPAAEEPMEIGIWSPEAGRRGLPLVVISHGTGGDFRSHVDSAEALAGAGFIVVAVTHPGDNWRDTSRTFAVWRRPQHLKLAVDYMLQQWPARDRVDADRIGAFGFSAGGFTVLVAAGGVPDLARIADHCRAHPLFFDCGIAANAPVHLARAIPWVRDPRLRAVAVAAPALGFTFDRAGLARIAVPVQLWRAERDQVLPHPFYVEPVRSSLPAVPDYRVVSNAGHFDFLSPCSQEAASLRPHLCTSAPGFDRTAFHKRLNAELVRFFRLHLRARVPLQGRGPRPRGGRAGAPGSR
jgi:predicted dienelactone hydrolase